MPDLLSGDILNFGIIYLAGIIAYFISTLSSGVVTAFSTRRGASVGNWFGSQTVLSTQKNTSLFSKRPFIGRRLKHLCNSAQC